MSKIIAIFTICMVGLAGTASAGSWVDDFEGGISAFWAGADGQANGISDTAQAHGGTKSMLVQQVPTETRPHRLCAQDAPGNPATTGTVTVYVYDDGADIKAFDVHVGDDNVSTATIGLRDSTVGGATNYTFGFSGSNASTGILRSTGWHKFQFCVNSAGADLRIDDAGWTGHISPAITQLRRLQINVNLGNASDANNIWIDDAQFSEGATLPPASAVEGWRQYE